MVCALAAFFGSCGGTNELASDTERIVFFGDSITELGVGPEGYVTLVKDSLERGSGGRIDVIGAGISGHRVPDLLARVDRDVLAKKPSLTIIYIGINDVWHWQLSSLGTPKAEYEEGLNELTARIQEAGSQVILCTPSVIGERQAGTNTMDTMLAEYAEISRSVAREKHVQICDLHAAFAEYLRTHNGQDAGSGILTTDGVHLNAEGNRFVAGQMLAAIAKYRAGAGATDEHK